MSVRLEHGDCLDVMARLLAEGVRVDSVVTDPPYHLTSIVKRMSAPNAKPVGFGSDGRYQRVSRGFMGKQWDGGNIAFRPETWAACFAVMKPGAHLVAFGGTRTHHRIWCAIEDAGFEVRDTLAWLYGSGFPKSHNAGNGWGTALKPAFEPIILARKPLDGTVAANVLAHGTGALNIDGCRVETGGEDLGDPARWNGADNHVGWDRPHKRDIADREARAAARIERAGRLGRWPANVLHDGSDEVLQAFPNAPGQQRSTGPEFDRKANVYGKFAGRPSHDPIGDAGSAARFFYCAKADADDRLDSKHPTVKPVSLMRWLVRLVTPKGGLVLDPFAGTGTTGMACMREGFNAILIEREAEYVADIKRRLAHVKGEDAPLFTSQAANE